MDYLWTPWRYNYIAEPGREANCIFCQALAVADDARALIVFRGSKNFIILNRFPYTTGHSMVVPYAHIPGLADAEDDTLTEMIELGRRLQMALEAVYHPQGYNLGVNLGRCAGAGVTGHLHMHVLPRWNGDTSFITTVAETRLGPEELAVTYDKLHAALSHPESQRDG